MTYMALTSIISPAMRLVAATQTSAVSEFTRMRTSIAPPATGARYHRL